MSSGESIKVEGVRDLLRTLKQVRPELNIEIKEANKELAEDLVPVARAKARRLTGKLAGSVRAGASQRSGFVRAGGARVPYAGPQHFGWPRRGISPNPFLWDALDSRRAVIEREYVERVRKIVAGVHS